MTRWTYEEVREIYADRDKYRVIVLEIAEMSCFGPAACAAASDVANACLICRAKATVKADAARFAARAVTDG